MLQDQVGVAEPGLYLQGRLLLCLVGVWSDRRWHLQRDSSVGFLRENAQVTQLAKECSARMQHEAWL